MSHVLRLYTLLILFSLIWAPVAFTKITDAHVRKEDRLLVPLDEPFGFGPGGRINITLSKFTLFPLYDLDKKTTISPSLKRMGLTITTPYGGLLLEEAIGTEGTCALDSDEQITLITFDEIDLATKSIDREIVLDELLENFSGGEFILYFANCEPQTAVDFELRLALYNRKDQVNDFLPVGQDVLPLLYTISFFCFLALGSAWWFILHMGKENTQNIHRYMGIMVVLKASTVLCQAFMYHMIARYGHSEGWLWLYHIFTGMRGLMFFGLLVLIASGYGYMKPFLSDREKQILMVVLPLQFFANIAIVVMDETTPAARGWFSFRDIFHVIDILCCCAVLFPIVWSIKKLREASEVDDKAARALSKLVLLRQFYIMVVSYIYFTRIIVYLLEATLPFTMIWLSNFALEAATLAFYIACGMQFRPSAAGANPYFALNAEEVELARP